MSLFKHPHLTRGIIHTSAGAFTVNRGFVELPDEIGEFLGWARVSPDGDTVSGDESGAAAAASRAASAALRADRTAFLGR